MLVKLVVARLKSLLSPKYTAILAMLHFFAHGNFKSSTHSNSPNRLIVSTCACFKVSSFRILSIFTLKIALLNCDNEKKFPFNLFLVVDRLELEKSVKDDSTDIDVVVLGLLVIRETPNKLQSF